MLNTEKLVAINCKNLPNYHYLSRNERYAEGVRKSAEYLKIVTENSLDDDTQYFVRS